MGSNSIGRGEEGSIRLETLSHAEQSWVQALQFLKSLDSQSFSAALAYFESTGRPDDVDKVKQILRDAGQAVDIEHGA